mgnify:CR=1 FL=1
MPKPPFVAKENVERFILSFVHENKKLPTMAEIRNHFGGGSMNRYSEILKGMNISAPEKKSPLTLDPLETSQLMGIKINRVISVTFVIGSFLAGVGSLLYFTNYTTVIQTSGAMPGLKAFVAAVFGGIGSVPGAVVGAFIIGICENIIKGLDVILIKAGLSKQMLGLTTFSDAFTFALLIVILIVKPTGLFGEKTTDKV